MNYNSHEVSNLLSLLLQIKAIKLNPEHPFTWASGMKSPIYCDNRITLSYPKIRSLIRRAFAQLILQKYGKPDVIAGVATAGIAHGVLVAQELDLPFVYVRSTKKEHGLSNQIEGLIDAGQTVVVIEDLISTGGSSLQAVKTLRERGAIVKGVVAIFTYGLQIATESFQNFECDLHALVDFDALLLQALKENYISNDEYQLLLDWKKTA